MKIVRRSKGGAGLLLCDVEAEKCHAWIFLITLLGGGWTCFSLFLSFSHRRANTGLNHVVGVSNQHEKGKEEVRKIVRVSE